LARVTQPTLSSPSGSTAAGGARKKNGLPGAGQRCPRVEMQHSRLSTTRSAARIASTTAGATSAAGGSSAKALATARPSIVSPASATVAVIGTVIAARSQRCWLWVCWVVW